MEVDLLQPRSDLGTLFGPKCYHYNRDGPDMPHNRIGYSTRARQLVQCFIELSRSSTRSRTDL